MYNERYLDWASTGTVPNEDEVVALLTEYSQSQAAFGGGGGGGGGGSFGGMFGDWVAIGYDGGPIPLVDPPLQV
jgi:hypothetical protein